MARTAARTVVVAVVVVVVAAITASHAAVTPDDGSRQSIRIDVQGAVALVTVTRTLACAALQPQLMSTRSDARDTVLDIALPERSALLDVNVGLDPTEGSDRLQTARPVDASEARDAYLESLRAMGLAASELPFEDEARYRIRLGCRAGMQNKSRPIQYTFSTLLEFSGDRVRLSFPGAPELSPPLTRVEVRVRPTADISEVAIGGATHHVRSDIRSDMPMARETVSTRGRWLVSLGPIRARSDRGEVPRLAALASEASSRAGAKGAAATPGSARAPGYLAYTIGAPPGPRQVLPERVLFVIDRSRSVGPGGLEAERDLARKFLEALPPSTRFDALFFDRGQQRLFPMLRPATREAIAALEREMVPGRLANGTDLGAALRAAGDLLRREANDFSPRCLLILLGDGAIGRPAGGASLARLLGPLPGVGLQVAALSVRPVDDPDVSLDERRVLRELSAAATLGGIERSIRMGETTDAVISVLEALRAGGEIYRVAIGATTTDAAAVQTGPANARQAEQMEVIAPGGGASGVISLPPRGAATPRRLSYRFGYDGLRRASDLRPIKVDSRWLAPLLASGAAGESRLLVGPAIAALVEPVRRAARPDPSSTAAPAGPRGYLERSVVRDALSIAYTPRARACYLNRSARTAAERDLSGRVRLALDLVRGEVASARVEASTLAHPVIETCLREAAYALDVPRAYHNDDPVTAVLNLVFRPRTPERQATLENRKLDGQLDTIVEAALKDYAAADTAPTPSPTTTPDAGPAQGK